MAEALFPIIGLPVSIIALAIGAMMFWDILGAYGITKGPDKAARQSAFFAWLVREGRVGQSNPPTSLPLMWWRLLLIWAIGGGMLALWITEVLGS